jgi:hypothetical protein
MENEEMFSMRSNVLLDRYVDKLIEEYHRDPINGSIKAINLANINMMLATLWLILSNHKFKYATDWCMFDSDENGLPCFSKIFTDDPNSHDRIVVCYQPDSCEIELGIYNTSCFNISIVGTNMNRTTTANDEIQKHPLFGILKKAVEEAEKHVERIINNE